jgi:transcriptional regulator with XRE-family HTH domain
MKSGSSFAFYIRAALWLNDTSQAEFAAGGGLTLNEAAAVEAGILVPRPEQVRLMADYFGVDRDWFCRLAEQARAARKPAAATTEEAP